MEARSCSERGNGRCQKVQQCEMVAATSNKFTSTDRCTERLCSFSHALIFIISSRTLHSSFHLDLTQSKQTPNTIYLSFLDRTS